MSRREVMRQVRGICNTVAENLGYELVDVEYVKESGRYFLRIYIHKDGGVNLDDCQMMSEAVGESLDKEDPIKNTYYLEVSSPGLDRPLKTNNDLKRNLQKDIEINLYSPLENKKKYEGKLIDFSEEFIMIEEDDSKIVEIPREKISRIRLAVKF